MRNVGRKDTAPELNVRRFLHRAGLRYVLHPNDLPGRPDLVLPHRRSVVFVHGCFWHGHTCRHGAVRAKSNPEYWDAKIADNIERDKRQNAALRRLGWHVEVMWECMSVNEIALARLARRLRAR